MRCSCMPTAKQSLPWTSLIINNTRMMRKPWLLWGMLGFFFFFFLIKTQDRQTHTNQSFDKEKNCHCVHKISMDEPKKIVIE